MSKTRIAQKAVHMIVALNVAAVIHVKVSDQLDLEDESITLDVGSFVVGQLVANQTDRVTDPAITKIVTTWQARRADKAEDPAE